MASILCGVLKNGTNRILRYLLYLNFFRSPTLKSQEASKLSTDVQKHANLCTVHLFKKKKKGGRNQRSLLGPAELNTYSTFRSPSQRIQKVSSPPNAKGEFPRFSQIHLTFFPAGHYHLASEVLVSTEGRICDWSTLWSMGSKSV